MPIHIAGKKNSKDVFKLLMSKGANIYIKTPCIQDEYESYGGKSLLHYTAKTNAKEIFEILIAKGVDINAKDIHYKIILF